MAARHSSLQSLFNVSPTTSEYEYSDFKRFCEIYYSEYDALEKDKTGRKSQYIIFVGVDEQTFEKDLSEQSNRSPTKSYCDYISAKGLLLVKMPTRAHEDAHISLDRLIRKKIMFMNPSLEKDLCSLGRSRVEAILRRKEPDQSYQPKTLPPGRSDYWPTVVIEAGYSESRSKLSADARWWLAESAGDVKTALTIAVHQTRREITVEKWELIERPTRQDGDKKVSVITQRAIVSQRTAGDPIRVTGSQINIPFEHLFLRPAGSNEGAIVFEVSDLEELATEVWRVHAKV